MFTPKFGEDEPIFDSYFSKGLKPPTSQAVKSSAVLLTVVFLFRNNRSDRGLQVFNVPWLPQVLTDPFRDGFCLGNAANVTFLKHGSVTGSIP